jgi:hypothetical protein
MRGMGFSENLVEWTKSFMEERKVVRASDRHEGLAIEVVTGFPNDQKFHQSYLLCIFPLNMVEQRVRSML